MKRATILEIILLILIISIPFVSSVNTIVVPTKIKPVSTSANLFNPTTNITNIVYVNTTNYVYTTNNITNNVTTLLINNITNTIVNNVTTYVNYTVVNNITNNLTNVVTFFSYQNFTYNITNDNYITNNITNFVYVNTTNNITNDNYITNNITNFVYFNLTNNITTYVMTNITNDIVNNVTTFIVNNITNDNFIYFNLTNNITNDIVNNITTYVTNNVTIIFNTTNNITNNYTYVTNITYNITTPFNYSDYFNQALNTTSNVEFASILYYNTTSQLKSYFDTLYYSILNPQSFINATVSSMTNFYNKSDINLLVNNLSYIYSNGSNSNINKLSFNTGVTQTFSIGELGWDNATNTLSVGYPYGTTLNLGTEMYDYVKNIGTETINEGDPVSIISVSGGIKGAVKTNISNSTNALAFIGIATTTMVSNAFGVVTTIGQVHNINTNYLLEGYPVYINTTGGLTNTPATAPNYNVKVGITEVQSIGSGVILVRPIIYPTLQLLSDVDGTPLTQDGQVLVWNNSRQVWDANYNLLNYLSITDQRYNDTTLINSKINGTNNYIAMFSNSTLVNSPIQRIVTDEDNLLFYNGDFYIDDTNGMVGVNILSGTETYNQAFTVRSSLKSVSGNLTCSTYNSTSNTTLCSSTSVLPEPLVDASTIWNGTTNLYYVFNIASNTSLYVIGNRTGIKLTNWSYKQAPYIDVNGDSTEERGYTISSNGSWEWAMYSPYDTNNSQFCVQNRNAWFNNQSDAFCIDTSGNMNVNGKLLANGYYGEIFNSTSTTRTLTTQNVWYNLTSYGSGELSGWTYLGNGALRCDQAGLYNVAFEMSASVNNNDVVQYQFILNNVAITKSVITQRYSTGQQDVITGLFLQRFNVNDVIQLQVQDTSRNGAILSQDNRNIIVQRIGN